MALAAGKNIRPSRRGHHSVTESLVTICSCIDDKFPNVGTLDQYSVMSADATSQILSSLWANISKPSYYAVAYYISSSRVHDVRQLNLTY